MAQAGRTVQLHKGRAASEDEILLTNAAATPNAIITTDASGRFPPLDGSQITGITGDGVGILSYIRGTGIANPGTVTTSAQTIALDVPVSITNGGTGQTTTTAAFDALAPTTTEGDLIYHNGTDNVRLAKGTAGQVLTMNAGATAPEWAAAAGATENVMRRVTAATGVSTFGTDLQTLITAATSGDWVQVISGTISTKTITLKSGVNLRFEDGVLLSDVKFQDNGAAVTCTIDGLADVANSNTRLIDLTHASSVVRATFGSVVGVSQAMLAADGGGKIFCRTFGVCDWSDGSAISASTGSKIYYDFDELKGGQASSTITYCTGANSEIWLRGRKLWTAVDGKIAYNDSGDCYQNIDVDLIQSTSTNYAYGLLYPNTGTIDVRARLITTAAGPAVYGNMGGNLTIRDARIQSTRNSATLGVPIDMAGAASAGRLTLKDCVLIAHSAASVCIIATAANDVYVHGTLFANQDKDADITLRGGALTFDTTYIL